MTHALELIASLNPAALVLIVTGVLMAWALDAMIAAVKHYNSPAAPDEKPDDTELKALRATVAANDAMIDKLLARVNVNPGE